MSAFPGDQSQGLGCTVMKGMPMESLAADLCPLGEERHRPSGSWNVSGKARIIPGSQLRLVLQSLQDHRTINVHLGHLKCSVLGCFMILFSSWVMTWWARLCMGQFKQEGSPGASVCFQFQPLPCGMGAGGSWQHILRGWGRQGRGCPHTPVPGALLLLLGVVSSSGLMPLPAPTPVV